MNILSSAVVDAGSKPRMLFFRTTSGNLPAFIAQHLVQHMDCLSLFFNVTLIEGDCDYDQMCDRYCPDISLFESGIYSRRSTIANALSHPHVPRVGLYHGDAYCSSRLTFLQDMRRLEIGTYFTISTRLSDFLTEETADIFYWPNFVDPQIHRDYGLPKAIPVLFTGSLASHYPWRNRIKDAIAPHYPILNCPHPGWFNAQAAERVATGSEYARLINFAHVTPTCGTVADEVVRKHFEIPACRSLLVTQRTFGTVAAGFVDMENCVFADPGDVVERLDGLLRDPERMTSITDAGYRLAHARHTAHQRDQILQWFRLRAVAREGERIVQATPFAPLSLNRTGAGRETIDCRGSLRRLLDEGNARFASGSYSEAARAFSRCLNYHPLPEALVGLARCNLFLGQADRAVEPLRAWIDGVLSRYQAPAPDPVEYALLVIACLCQGNTGEALRRLAQFPDLSHAEIDWAAAAVAAVEPGQTDPRTGHSAGQASSATVHRPLWDDEAAWMSAVQQMLTACGQPEMARRIALRDISPTGRHVVTHSRRTAARVPDQKRLSLEQALTSLARRKQIAPFVATLARTVTRDGRLQKFASLPFARRLRKFDDFAAVLREHVSRTPASKALLVQGAGRSIYVEEFLDGIKANPDMEALFVLGPADAVPEHFLPGRAGSAGTITVTQIRPADLAAQPALPRVDLLFIEKPAADRAALGDHCRKARHVILSGINDPVTFDLFQQLSTEGSHFLVAHDPAYGAGYAILERWGERAAERPYRPSPLPAARHAARTSEEPVE